MADHHGTPTHPKAKKEHRCIYCGGPIFERASSTCSKKASMTARDHSVRRAHGGEFLAQ